MTETLYHRGPDASGTKLYSSRNYQVGLGQRRLAVIDLSEGGKQPMHFLHYTVVFNGEIYNYREIRQELEERGHRFVSNSDTEVILHAYAEWGTASVQKFIGMFAIVVYDRNKEELICFRDRAGVKPFFYYWKDGLFLFGSELKAFEKHPRFQKAVDTDALASYMQFGNIPAPYCIYKDSYKLEPGHYLNVSLTNQKTSISRYWSVYDTYNQPKLDLSFAEAVQHTEELLSSAFKYRMVADVPVGVFLSGGYDSTCVVSLLQKDSASPLKTFTIAVPDIGLNEAPYAKTIARHLGTDHYEMECSEQEAVALIADLPFYYDEPFADSSAIPTMLVSKMARQQVTVALSADGGDEIFAGYNRYDYMERFGKRLSQWPGFVRHGMAALMESVPGDRLPWLRNRYNFHNRYEKLKVLLKDPAPENVMRSLTQLYPAEKLRQIMAVKYKCLPDKYASKELKAEYFSSLAYIMAIDYETYLTDDIMQKVDRASMAFSLESREPFLDHRIIEWAARLPDTYKYDNGVKKRILRELVHHYVPKSMMERPKMGFAIPVDKWLRGALKPHVMDYLSEEKLKQHGYFSVSEVIKLRDAFLGGKRELSQKIWYLLMFQMWYERWMRSN
ncbi:MAG: asparagine synthase (glutamine-hydrolyzing) [Sediminibacterium sp.]|nr:asparagine synthase (glutamine-hydrolyzing) [Sediminibacterium sp.]